MAAIYSAKIDAVYFCNTEKRSLEYAIVDKLILNELSKPEGERKNKSQKIGNPGGLAVLRRQWLWE